MPIRFVQTIPPVDAATLIASSGFVKPVTDGLRQDVDVHLHEGQTVFSILDDDTLVGFAIFNRFENLLYLGGIILRESHQGKGIAFQAVAAAQEQRRSRWFGMRTQSLRMWVAAHKWVDTLYPHPTIKHEGYFAAAQTLSSRLHMDAPVVAGFYGGPLYGAKPMHHDPKLQRWWDLICDFERGDAVVCVGRFPRG